MKSFRIGAREVGGDAPVFFVAELSANHGGKLEIALETIERAAKCGADAIKIQTYTPDTLTLRSSAERFVVKTKNEWSGRTLHDLYAEAMTPWEWHEALRDCAAASGIALFSTPFDATAVDFLERLAMPAHKIASFEIVDLPLVERTARTGKPIIISTGMASFEEIEAAVKVCREAGNDQIALLRCVSAYPARPESMGLASLPALASLGCVVGLSDHTRDPVAAITAVALGAKVVEKHVILRRELGGPDAFFSLEPEELKATIDAIRTAEAAIGRPRFGPAEEELPSLAFRRSLFVARDVPEGKALDADDVRSVRPAGGMPARELPAVLGCVAATNLRAGEPLAPEMIGARQGLGTLRLRPATSDDAAELLRWRNDAQTRAMSVARGPVEPSQHAAWLAAALRSADRRLYVAEDGGPVGQIRLDRCGPGAFEVSVTVAPEARGRGLAATMLRAAEETALALGASLLTAWIRLENEASTRAFKRAGYHGFARRERDGEPFVFCERRVRAYA